ncbi:MAG: HD domain-containing protein [Desulfatitalea sp.]|nr:HD domain-containing protein [Desulfatitalea sp.]NNK01218.1 HD domain-containing protein [Desulfatitalea sp.]
MLTEQQKLDSLIRLGIELSRVNDLDILMERVLTRARQFSNADAGSIYIRKNDWLHFSYTQNDTLQKKLPKGEKLIYSTFKVPIDTKSIAGYVATVGRPLNIDDVYDLDKTLPYQHGKRFDDTMGYRTQSVLTIPLINSIHNNLGILQIINALDPSGNITTFSSQDKRTMDHFASVAAVALERAQMTRALILRMIRMAEMRDPRETGEHVNRVAGYAVTLYEQWALRHHVDPSIMEKTRDILRMAAMLHDVGKVATSDLILKKPARLDLDEREVMKQHTIQGARLFMHQQSDFDEAAGIVALNHHEHWDGSGYPGHVDFRTGHALAGYTDQNGLPRGKRGYEIPLFGRIVALADVYDALSTKRPYRDAWEEKHIRSKIRESAGTQFDPELVNIFFNAYGMLRSIKERYSETDDDISIYQY